MIESTAKSSRLNGGNAGAPYREVYQALRSKAESAPHEGQEIPSYNQLAKQFNVSVSTVVRAINLLKREGWAYGRQGRGTFIRKRNRSEARRQVAFITPALAGDTNSYLKGLHESLDGENISVGTYSTHADLTKYQRMIEQVLSLKPAGVILTTLPDELCHIDPTPLMESSVPLVLIGPPVKNLCRDRIFQSGRDSGGKLARHLLDKGYGDFAMLMEAPVSDEHKAGMLYAIRKELERAGEKLPDDKVFIVNAAHGYITPVDPSVDAELAMNRILSEGTRFETLVCCHDYPAIGAMRALLDAGLRVPEDVRVVSGMRCTFEGVGGTRLTTIDSHREEQAALAAETLLRRIDGFDGPLETHYVAGELIIGETT